MKWEVFAIFILFTGAKAKVGTFIHDDLIIAVGDHLEFLSHGNTHHTLVLNSYNASKLSALAYDATTRKLFFSDIRHHQSQILSVSLEYEKNSLVEEIVEKSHNESVESLAYDPVDKMLLWTDGFNKSIRQVRIDNDNVQRQVNTSVEIVHLLGNDAKPRGLVSDPCTRMIYWTSIHDSIPTIERSLLDGSRREIIVHSDLLLPNAFDVDIMEQMIYWAEDLRNGYFLIERSYVNGTGREEFYRGVGHFIASLTVGHDYVYWSDYDSKKLWSLHKDGTWKNPVNLRTFRDPAMGVVIHRNEPLNCDFMSSPGARDDNDSVNKTELIENMFSSPSMALLGFTFVCLIVMAIIVFLVRKCLKPRDCKGWASETEDTVLFQNFNDTSSFKMEDLLNAEETVSSLPVPETSYSIQNDDVDDSNDCATLIKSRQH